MVPVSFWLILLITCPLTVSPVAMIQYLQKQFKGERFIWLTIPGTSQRQAHEAGGHIATTVRKQEEVGLLLSWLSPSISPGEKLREWSCPQLG